MRRVVHLVDDTRPGGVTRLLDYVRASEDMAALGRHVVVPVGAAPLRPPRLQADVIVSHVVLSWRNLPFLAALRARHPRVPMIHMEHSYSPAFAAMHVVHPGRFRAMLTASLRLFDRVVTISTAQRDWLVPLARLDPDRVVLIPPCVEVGRFLALPAPEGAVRRIGALGRLDPQKGFDLLIRAHRAAALPGVTIEIHGEGPQRAELEALAGGDPTIVFHGHAPDPVAAMASVDAIAMPSRREPYGLVALETMAAGRPLLVSDVDGLRDHAANGAVAVAHPTVDAWAAALVRLVRDGSEGSELLRRHAAGAGARFAAGWARLIDDVAR